MNFSIFAAQRGHGALATSTQVKAVSEKKFSSCTTFKFVSPPIREIFEIYSVYLGECIRPDSRHTPHILLHRTLTSAHFVVTYRCSEVISHSQCILWYGGCERVQSSGGSCSVRMNWCERSMEEKCSRTQVVVGSCFHPGHSGNVIDSGLDLLCCRLLNHSSV